MKRMLILLLTQSLTALGATDACSFKQGANVFRLVISSQPTKTSAGPKQIVRYQVFRNGIQIPGREGDGRFLICRKDPPEVRPLGCESGRAGWVILGGGICGNTMSDWAEVVAVAEGELLTKGFICKEPPVVKPNRHGFDIWFYQQNWGKGGTATSIFVPRKLTLVLDGHGNGFYTGDLLEGFEVLEQYPGPEWLRPNFINLFVAGIQDANPELMEFALQRYYSPADTEWYETFVADGNRTHLLELIARTKWLRALFDEMEMTVDWDLRLKPF